MTASLFTDIGVILIAATLLGLLARRFKQPLLLGYMLAGLLIGPIGLRLVTNYDNILLLSELGIAFLLFVVGLELDVRKLKDLGFVSLATGIGQVVFTFIVGYFLLTLLGFSSVVSFYVSVALTLSSTVVIIKLLSDKKELGTLHGRIALGILLVQDFVAVIALSVLSGTIGFTPLLIAWQALKGIVLFGIGLVLGVYVLRKVFKPIAKNTELLFLAAIAWCFAFAMGATALGFSVAIGAFVAGVSLASLPYTVEIESRTKSLRDFFTTIFFVTLGMQLTLTGFTLYAGPMLLLSAFVLAGNPLIVITIMSMLGFKARPSFLTGITIAQISEFSLVMSIMGVHAGIISPAINSMIAMIALITFTVSSYMISYDHDVYQFFKKAIKPFEKLNRRKLVYGSLPKRHHQVVLCGANRIGHSILNTLKDMGKSVLVVDFNPDTIKRLNKEKVHAVYGDIGDAELLNAVKLHKAQIIISTIQNKEDTLLLLNKARRTNKKAHLIVTAFDSDEALEFYARGADYVLIPHLVGGDHMSTLLAQNLNKQALTKLRADHVGRLHEHARH